MRLFGKIVSVLLLFFVLSACSFSDLSSILPGQEKEQSKHTYPRFKAQVVKVLDGDTIKIRYQNKEETVRFLLVDTPETVHPTKSVQPFGPEASAYTKKRLTNKTVEIEIDVGERDKYGRLLAYVYEGGKMINRELLEKGYARVAYVFAPNTRYVDEFREIQKKAQQKKVGIWSIEDYSTGK